eukprot:jgi/Botrbrau1/18217/Bobra.53_1s0074.1
MARDWFRKRRQDESSFEFAAETDAGYGGAVQPRPYASLDGGPSLPSSLSHETSNAVNHAQPRYPPVQYSHQNSFGVQYATSPQTPSPFARLSSSAASLPLSVGTTSSQGHLEAAAALEQFEFETALALSKTAEEEARAAASSEDTAIARAKRLSLQPVCCGGKAEALSYKLWDTDSLDYSDLIVDGLYDICGDFDEFRSPEGRPTFPTLLDLKSLKPGPDDMREAVEVNRDRDPGLCEVEGQAAEAIAALCEAGPVSCVQGLASVVAKRMGGACSLLDLKQNYQAYFAVLRAERTSMVVPIGALEVGLPRHRALLFKTLADACELPCKILRGLNLGLASGGWPGAAVVVVRVNTDQELLVDLIQNPGNTYSVRPESIPKILPPVDGASACAWDGLSGGLGVRSQSVGLEWQEETEEPALIALGEPEGRGQSGESAMSATTASTPVGPMSRVTSQDGGPSTSSSGPPAIEVPAGAPIRAVRLGFRALPSPYADDELQSASMTFGPEPASARTPDNVGSGPPSTSRGSAGPGSASNHPVRPEDLSFESYAFGSPPRTSPAGPPSLQHSPAGPPRRASPFDAGPGGVPIMQSPSLPALQPGRTGPPVQTLASLPHPLRPGEMVRVVPPGGHTRLAPQAPGAQVASSLPKAEPVPTPRPSPRDSAVRPGETRPGVRSMTALEAAGIVKGPADPFANLSPFESLVPGALGQPMAARSGSLQVPMRGVASAPNVPNITSPRTTSAGLQHWTSVQGPGKDGIAGPSGAHRSPADRSPVPVPQPSGAVQLQPQLVSQMAERSPGSQPQVPQATTPQVPTAVNIYDAWAPSKVQAAVPSLADVAVLPQADGSEQQLLASTEERRRALVAEAEEWEIAHEEIDWGGRIGIGSYGEVYRATWRHTDVAVKRFLEQDVSPQLLEEFRAEIAIMKRLKHPNVVLFMGAITQPPHLSIVTQFVPRGSLFRLLHRTPNVVLDDKRKLRMAMDIARGMNYLHSCKPPVIHRDLKSPNLLVDKDFTVKVCDFGLARVRRSTWLSGKSQAGTPEWTAPEVLRSQSYNEKSDVYSFGVVLWELFTGEEPWQDKTPMQVVGAVGWGDARLQLPDTLPPVIHDLILQCFGQPEQRPSFSQAIEILKPLLTDGSLAPPSAGPGHSLTIAAAWRWLCRRLLMRSKEDSMSLEDTPTLMRLRGCELGSHRCGHQ